MDTNNLQVWTDGSATYLKTDGRPNNGANALCFSMYSLWCGAACLEEVSKQIGYGTVNQSEFIGVIMGVSAALKYKPKCLNVYSDSQIVVNAIMRRNTDCSVVGAAEWIPALWEAVEPLEHFKITWVKRHKNRADGLNRKLAKEQSAQP